HLPLGTEVNTSVWHIDAVRWEVSITSAYTLRDPSPPPGANRLPLTNRSKPTILSRFCSKNDSLLARIFNYFISLLMPEILHL
ncbi:hypothetical protein, partial [Klebsiella variicola]